MPETSLGVFFSPCLSIVALQLFNSSCYHCYCGKKQGCAQVHETQVSKPLDSTHKSLMENFKSRELSHESFLESSLLQPNPTHSLSFPEPHNPSAQPILLLPSFWLPLPDHPQGLTSTWYGSGEKNVCKHTHTHKKRTWVRESNQFKSWLAFRVTDPSHEWASSTSMTWINMFFLT